MFLNRSPESKDITADWKTLGLDAGVKVSVRDLWLRKSIAEGVAGSFTAKAVPAHGVLAVALAPTA